MSLQGTLETFALPDVMRLLASTAKTGRLRIDGSRGVGELWLHDGAVVGAAASRLGPGPEVTDVVFEMMRFTDGAFVFDAGHMTADAAAPVSVDEVLAAGGRMLDQWVAIEQVVPSSDHRVELRPELAHDDVTIDADTWRSVAAVGSGCSVAELGRSRGLGELGAGQAVVRLVELGLAEVLEPATAVDVAPAGSPAGPGSLGSPPPDEPGESPWGVVDDGGWSPDGAVPAAPDLEAGPAPAGGSGGDRFDPAALFRDGPGTVPLGAGPPIPEHAPEAAESDDFADDPFGPDPFASLPDLGGGRPVTSAGPDDADAAAELARQLGTLSPRAARAGAAAAGATSAEERDSALAEVDDAEPVDRALLLRFLSSVDE